MNDERGGAGATLRTSRLLLDPTDPARDAGDLHAAFSDPGAMRFWDTPATPDVAATAARLVGYLAVEGAAYWTVREAPDGPALGLVGMLGAGGVPGVQWIVVPQRWSEGIASEATTAMVDHLLAHGTARLEAWIETANPASAAVARRSGFVPRGRLVQRYEHRTDAHESTVWGREAEGAGAGAVVVGTIAELPVGDPSATAQLLTRAFGARVLLEHGDPVELVALGLGAWSGAAVVHLVRTGALARLTSRPVDLLVETVSDVDALVTRATAVGLRCVQAPRDEPWCRREAVLTLAEGHRLRVSAPA